MNGNGESAPTFTAAPRMEISIAYDPGGGISMRSNVQDAALFLGILELAKDSLLNRLRGKAENPGIVVAPAGLRVT